jgi:hypothetical protein
LNAPSPAIDEVFAQQARRKKPARATLIECVCRLSFCLVVDILVRFFISHMFIFLSLSVILSAKIVDLLA